MAALYASRHSDDFEGLLFLASYSTEDLKNTELKVLSVYGTEDKVLNMEKYKESFSNLPSSAEELIIKGGNHAYFGSYGKQKGDGEPAVTIDEQTCLTADFIAERIAKASDESLPKAA